MAESTKAELTFYSTNELIAELAKRHDALVIAGIRFTDVNGRYDIKRFHLGHRHVCLGMISNMESIINKIENASLTNENVVENS